MLGIRQLVTGLECLLPISSHLVPSRDSTHSSLPFSARIYRNTCTLDIALPASHTVIIHRSRAVLSTTTDSHAREPPVLTRRPAIVIDVVVVGMCS